MKDPGLIGGGGGGGCRLYQLVFLFVKMFYF